MSPHDPQNAIFNTAIAAAHYLAGRDAEAVVFGRKALQQRTQFTSGHRIYVASLAQAGQLDQAREALVRLKKVFPEMTIAWIERYVPYTSGPMAKFLEGMRKAGPCTSLGTGWPVRDGRRGFSLPSRESVEHMKSADKKSNGMLPPMTAILIESGSVMRIA
jgi:hypothetical protein